MRLTAHLVCASIASFVNGIFDVGVRIAIEVHVDAVVILVVVVGEVVVIIVIMVLVVLIVRVVGSELGGPTGPTGGCAAEASSGTAS